MDGTSRAVLRLSIGALQGAVLAGLYLAFKNGLFPATVPQLFAPLFAVAIFTPPIVSQALGNLRRPTLIGWSAGAAAIAAALAWYDVWHGGPTAGTDQVVSLHIVVILSIFLFVAHALVSCGDADGRIVARYPTLFDLAWKLGVQSAIVICFIGAFWILLFLGIALFGMIGFAGFERFVTDSAVAIPLTTIAAAAALHATDASAPLVRGVRGLALTLLSWLLPVIAAITLAFLVCLGVSGLQPLWETRTAASLLIAAVVVLVIHINAAYQDGEARPSHILRVSGTLASVLLVFLVWIAAYALWLRVAQYGWTVDRVTSAGCVAVAAMFAIGYLIAAVLPGSWLKFIERWNVYGTFFFLIVLFALATPIADPIRLSVQSQVARLQTGAVKPDKFDFWYLKESGGRFGEAALKTLSGSTDKTIAALAQNTLRYGDRIVAALSEPEKREAPPVLLLQIKAHPEGAVLPPSFLAQDWSKSDVTGSCLQRRTNEDWHCDAVVKDIDGDGQVEVILIEGVAAHDGEKTVELFRLTAGNWEAVGNYSAIVCDKELAALLKGEFTTPPQRIPDIEVLGRRLTLTSPFANKVGCR